MDVAGVLVIFGSCFFSLVCITLLLLFLDEREHSHLDKKREQRVPFLSLLSIHALHSLFFQPRRSNHAYTLWLESVTQRRWDTFEGVLLAERMKMDQYQIVDFLAFVREYEALACIGKEIPMRSALVLYLARDEVFRCGTDERLEDLYA